MSSKFYKALLIVSLIVAVITAALGVYLYSTGAFKETWTDSEKITKLIDRTYEIAKSKKELELRTLELSSEQKMLEVVNGQIEYTKYLLEKLPNDKELLDSLQKNVNMQTEITGNIDQISRYRDKLLDYLANLKVYVRAMCRELNTPGEITDKIAEGELRGEELLLALRNRGALK